MYGYAELLHVHAFNEKYYLKKKISCLNFFLIQCGTDNKSIKKQKLWLVGIQPEKTTRVFLVSIMLISMDITYVPGLWDGINL